MDGGSAVALPPSIEKGWVGGEKSKKDGWAGREATFEKPCAKAQHFFLFLGEHATLNLN